MVTKARNPTDRAALAARLRSLAPIQVRSSFQDAIILAADLIEQDGQRIAALEAEMKALRFDLNVAATEGYNEGYAAARTEIAKLKEV